VSAGNKINFDPDKSGELAVRADLLQRDLTLANARIARQGFLYETEVLTILRVLDELRDQLLSGLDAIPVLEGGK